MMRFLAVLPFVFFCLSSVECALAASVDPYAAYKYSRDMPQSVEDWGLARQKYLTDPAWKQWVDAERARLQRWQSRGGDKAEWVAGYMHDFFDPVTLKEMPLNEDTPMPPQGVPGSPEAKRFGAWVFFFRSRNASYVLLAARLFKLTGDRQALDWARSQITLYARQYQHWPVQTRAGSKTRLMSSSLDEANVMAMLVPAIRLVQRNVQPDELALWKSNLLQPSSRNLLDSYHGVNNISMWQRATVGSMALLMNDAQMLQEAIWGDLGAAAIMRAGTTRDGFWKEGTFGYSEYVVLALLPFLHEAAVYGKNNEVAPISEAALNLLVAPLALRFPDGSLPNPGDNRGEPKAFKRYLFRESSYLLPTPMGVVEWQAAKSWPRLFVDWAPQSEAMDKLPLLSHQLADTGFAMLRQHGWHLFMHFGQASPQHAQYEAMSFELQHDNGRVVTDLGTTVYGSPLHENYFRRAAAHSLPLVNDRGQSKFALGKLLGFDPERGSMVAQQPDYQPGVSVTRQFQLSPNSVSDVIDVRRNQVADGSIGVVIHLDCTIDLPILPGVPLPAMPADTGFGYWQQVQAFRVAARFELKADCAGNPVRVRVDGPAGGVLVTGKPPVLDGRVRSAFYLRYPVSQGRIQTTYVLQ